MSIPENLEAILARIAAARKAAFNPAPYTKLVAVSKTVDEAGIRAALAAGQRLFGENRVQEAQGKFPALKQDYPDLQLHLIGFMIGRFAGSGMMKFIRPAKLLAGFTVAALVCGTVAAFASGMFAIAAVGAIGACHSIMFPTIFALGIKGLGEATKLGSSLMVMAIVGGAVLPAAMGYISDHSTIQRALIVPLFCYLYILNFAVRSSSMP